MRQLAWLLAASVCLVAAPRQTVAQGSLEILHIDTSDFPHVHAWTRADGFDPSEGNAVVSLDPGLSDEQLEMLSSTGSEGSGTATSPDLGESLAVTTEGFTDQTIAPEGLLVVILVDISGSMDAVEGDGTTLDQAKELVGSIVDGLRDVDRVALATFTDHLEVVSASTNDHGQIRAEIAAMTTEQEEHSTRLYDAVVLGLQDLVRDEPTPTLPGRRIFVVLSDGRDEGSNHSIEDISPLLDQVEPRPAIVLVGLGDPAANRDRHDDLERIATRAGDTDAFLLRPSASEVAERIDLIVAPRRAEFSFSFSVPPYFWTGDEQHARLVISMPGGEEITADIPFVASALSTEQRERRTETVEVVTSTIAAAQEAAAQAEAERAAAESAEAAAKRNKLIGIAAGASILVLLLIGVVTSVRGSKLRKQQAARLDEVRQEIGAHIDEQVGRQQEAYRESVKAEAAKEVDRARRPIAVLLATAGPLNGQRFGLLGANVVAGRDPDRSDLLFPNEDPGISRVHARFGMEGASWQVTCLSDGGLKINDVSLRKGEQYPLRFGDQVKLGRSTFEFTHAG